MFLEFYNLRQQPFGVTPDPAYLYLTRTHRQALSFLLSGIKEGRGFFALIAEPGMGKTTLLYQLLDELRDSARTVFLFQTQCDSREFFQYLLNELGVDTRGMDRVLMHSKLNEILFAEMIAGRRFVLIVDEAQNLEDSVLETVRLLSNFETSYTKMLQIVLAGQPQLFGKLAQPQLAQLRQRLAVLARLEPLSEAETVNYIEHRLKVAGHSGAPLFAPAAVALITKLSGGIPRTINHLCYAALSAAYALRLATVAPEIVQEVAAKRDGGSFPADKPVPLEVLAGSKANVEPDVQADVQADAQVDVHVDVREDVEEDVQADAPANVQPATPFKTIHTRDERVKAPRPALSLTYAPARRLRLPRWALRAFVPTGLVLLAGISLTAFMLRRAEPETGNVAPVPARVNTNSGTAPPPASPTQRSVPRTGTTTSSSPQPQPTEMSYSADPEEAGASQVITVAAMPDQTIQDISLSYVGRFDAGLLQEVRALNPRLKDPDHLTAGQLIRLPLPHGSFTKGKDLTSEK